MTFLSFNYVYFLLGTASLFWILPKGKPRQTVLLVASYAFYGYAHAWYPVLLLASSVVAHVSGTVLSRKMASPKAVIWTNVAFNIGMLCVLKYISQTGAFLSGFAGLFGLRVPADTFDIILPIGVSFFTLQAISYVVDCANEKLAPRNLFNTALFIAFFPKLISGPLERADHFLPQFESNDRLRFEYLQDASYLFLRGLMKKTVVADNLKPYVDHIYGQNEPFTILLIAATVVFSIQILADFSGYTDLARGSAKLFGIDLFENFRFPYKAVSPSDFWRRWHVSLSNWFRDYVYIPLGGSRSGSRITFFLILMTTMTLSGAWHGATANYIVWGAYHGIILFVYSWFGWTGKWQPISKLGTALAAVTMYVWTLIGWSIFRSHDLGWLMHTVTHPILRLPLQQVAASIMLLLICLTFSVAWICITILERKPRAWRSVLAFWVLVIATGILGVQGETDFIYFQF